MGTKTFNNYEDLLTFTRASKGHALRPVSYGDELVTNGTFDSDLSGWDDDSIGSGTATVLSGQVSLTRADSSNRGGISQSHTLVSGKIYLLSFELVSGAVQAKYKGGSGSISQYFNGENWNQLTTSGVYQTRFVATGTDGDIAFLAINNGVTAVLDNISVKEVTFDESDGTLTLFEHPDNVPRVEWDADGNRLGLLVEESRTNLNPRSRPDSNWIASNVTLAENDSTAPDGTESATKITETTATSSHYTYAPAASFTSGTTYTISCFVKAGTKSLIQLTGSSGPFGGGLYANFDIANGTVGSTGSGTTATIQAIGNGWYRCVITGDATATAGASTAGVLYMIESLTAGRGPSFTGSTSNYLYAYGLQLEEASFPTSYIKTTGSTATRSADVATIPVADFGFNTGAGTFVAEFDFKDPNNDDNNYAIGGTSQARIIYNNAGNSLWQTFDGNAAVTFGELDNTGASRFKAAVGVKTGKNIATSLDGDIEASSTSATSLMENLAGQTLAIGGNPQSLNGHIKSIQYYPRRLSNAQLVELTS